MLRLKLIVVVVLALLLQPLSADILQMSSSGGRAAHVGVVEGGGEDPGGGDPGGGDPGGGDPGGGSEDIFPHLEIEYVNTNGTRTRTEVESGVTSITCVAPCIVSFDATGTLSNASDGDTEPEAIYNIGYRFNFGEGIGGHWDYPAYADVNDRPLKDEDVGPPITTYVYTVPGSYTARLRVRDSEDNEDTISFAVNISDPGAGVDISTGDGDWPDFQSDTVYNLDGDYTSFGPVDTTGLKNVVFRRKPGASSDPTIGAWVIESRQPNSSAAANPLTRSINIRMWNVNITGNITYAAIGVDYVGVIGGEMTGIDLDPSEAFYYNASDVTGEARLGNIRYSRGIVLWDCGEVTEQGNGYPVFASPIRAFHARNVVFNKTGGSSGAHAFRGIFSHGSVRSSLMTNSAASSSYIKIYGDSVNATYPFGTEWRSDDLVGHTTGTKTRYIYSTHKFFMSQIQLGRAGHTLPTSNVGCGPQSNSAGPDEPISMCGFEDMVWYETTNVSTGDQDAEMSGQYLAMRNMKKNMGAGSEVSKQVGVHTNRMPPGWDGPYLLETTNTRPVPSAFE